MPSPAPASRGEQGYRTREVVELARLSRERIRHYVRLGLVEPTRGAGNELRFSFEDIVVLRTARGLLDAAVPVRKANRALRRLKSICDRNTRFTSLRILAAGDEVLVRHAATPWNVETGQGHLDFAGEAPAANVTPLIMPGAPSLPDEHMSSDDWYNLALDLEELSPGDAPDAYRRSIELNAENADAWVNLGRLLQLDGRLDEALECYGRALDLEPGHQLARYNLGTVHDERGDLDAAVRCYQQAAEVADAHYNLARIYEMQGNELAAVRHLRRYNELVG